MGEKRKSDFVFLLKTKSKNTAKVEIFRSTKWEGKAKPEDTWGCISFNRYRIRVNGKWYGKTKEYQYTFLTRYEIRDLMWRSLSGWF